MRYADEANVYVCSRHAGERVVVGAELFLKESLKLPLNRSGIRVAGSCNATAWVTGWPRLVVSLGASHMKQALQKEAMGSTGAGLDTGCDKPACRMV